MGIEFYDSPRRKNKLWRSLKKRSTSIGAIIVFGVGTYFNVRSAQDAADSARSAKDSAAETRKATDIANSTFELSRTVTLLISCYRSKQANTLSSSLQDLRIAYPLTSASDRSIDDLTRTYDLPSSEAIAYCSVYNYGTVPVVNIYIGYLFYFYSSDLPSHLEFSELSVPDATIYIPAIAPASSAQY